MGKEAKARQDRKRQGDEGKSYLKFHVTDREQWALAMHALRGDLEPEGSDDHDRHARVFEEFVLHGHVDMCIADPKVGRESFDPDNYVVIKPARDTVSYVLKLCAKKCLPLHLISLNPLVRRMKQAEAELYRLPEDAPKEDAGPSESSDGVPEQTDTPDADVPTPPQTS